MKKKLLIKLHQDPMIMQFFVLNFNKNLVMFTIIHVIL